MKEAGHLVTILYRARPVAWIDSKGDFTCKNKRLMVKALRETGKFWLAVGELLREFRGGGDAKTEREA